MKVSSQQSAANQTLLPVRVLLFAVLRDTLKRHEIEIMVATRAGEPPIVADLVTACSEQFPAISAWLPHIRVAVDHEYAGPQTLLAPGAEVAFIPPVAGG
jgi:molybdopterin synthase catalytic subunit